ncbi:NADPH-dependent FMN reductase [Luteimonas arsenica]|uniref:NADPH-dependent FMN reductase n=1 Tax=Luteimonas arsenica TaxID=1586242 RepID=UPI001055FD8A|nr:NAD(P)H-dependent oxidoreductase [Luteimonas arsenica]
MSDIRIAVLVGSIRSESLNRALAEGLEKLLPDGAGFEYASLADLPPYNQDQDDDQPAPAKALKALISGADGVLFVTPEYNRSIPGVLKNAIDHASRPYGKSAFAGKPAGIVGISIGAIGTACAQQHLRAITGYLDMPTLGQPEVFLQAKDGLFDSDGGIGEGSRKFLQGWVDAYVAWVKKHRA